MARKCTVCTHRQREKIDSLLIAGTSYRDVSNRFSLSKTAVWRHRNVHLPGILAKAEGFRETQLANRLGDQITGLIEKSLAILGKAERLGDLKISLAAIRECRGNLELLGKATGQLNSGQEQRVIGPMFLFPEGSRPILTVTPPDEPVIEAEVVSEGEDS